MLQHPAGLFKGDTGKQLDELPKGDTILQVLEEGSDGYPRAAEDPGSAQPMRVLLYGGAQGPSKIAAGCHRQG
jgi:hypothetical protein